jgi:hypothetical protein
MSEEALTVTVQETNLANWYDSPPPKAVMRQALDLFVSRREAAKSILEEGVDKDYSQLPGTPKPSLHQPGADKLISAFGLTPRIVARPDLSVFDHEAGFYYIKNQFDVLNGDKVVGTGIGTASSKESKYAYRWMKKEQIESHPKLRDYKLDDFEKQSNQYGTRYKVPNPDIHDLVNTLEKMAAKRAKTSAVLQAFGLSSDFTTDMDDQEPSHQTKRQQSKSKPKKQDDTPPDKAVAEFIEWFDAHCDKEGWDADAKEAAEINLRKAWNLGSLDDIRPEQVDKAKQHVERIIPRYLKSEGFIMEE